MFFKMKYFLLLSFNLLVSNVFSELDEGKGGAPILLSSYVIWKNATVPFYVRDDHFDAEQQLFIMRSLSNFAMKTCIKFAPTPVLPSGAQHVMVFQNPTGKKRCTYDLHGTSVDEPHLITVPYECLKSPEMELVIMRGLGFAFEHSRLIRDVYVDVQLNNIEANSVDLFAKETRLPSELRNLPYDVNSVLHFGERDFSKNGHRTIIFKDHTTKQSRFGLSDLDLKKIDIVYGPECQKRDRMEKVELCQHYPGVARRKRDATSSESLRVNRDITPPPNLNENHDLLQKKIEELGIADEVADVIDQLSKVTNAALVKTRLEFCNETKQSLRSTGENTDVLEVTKSIVDYAKTIVDLAAKNQSHFCANALSIESVARMSCYNGGTRCPPNFRPTKIGRLVHSTQHRPFIYPYTQKNSHVIKGSFDMIQRSKDDDNSTDKEAARKKRDLDDVKEENAVFIKLEVNPKNNENVTGDTEADFEIDVVDRQVNGTRRTFNALRRIKNDDQGDSGTDLFKLEEKRGLNKHHKKEDLSEKHKRMEEEDAEESKELTAKEREELKYKNLNKEQLTEENEEEEVEELEKKKVEEENLLYKKRWHKHNLPRTVNLSRQNKEFYEDRKWPENIVRYILSDDGTDVFDKDDLISRLEEVNSILKKKTCVRLQHLSKEDTERFEDYVIIDTSPDYVTGRVGGKQSFGSVDLFQGGQHRQHAAMMVMAMLGFYFEVARHDRDKYIKVHNRHIRPDKLHHFEPIREAATMRLPYDYKSATHPAWQFWRKLGRTGISSVATYKDKDPDGALMKSLGQNQQLLSEIDIIKINSVYGIECFKKSFKSQKKIKMKKD